MIDAMIQKHGKRLYGLCLTLCADPFRADDLYQETWMKAMQHLDRYDPGLGGFEAWLTQICVNTYRNDLRRLMRSPFLQFKSTEEQSAIIESVPTSEIPDYSDLHQAIQHLPDKLRLTIILFYFYDMDIISVSKTLRIPVGTVKSRLNKARRLLKEVLSNETDL